MFLATRSRDVGRLHDDNRIESFRLGRENVLTLAEGTDEDRAADHD